VKAAPSSDSGFVGAPGIDGLASASRPRLGLWVLLVVLVLVAEGVLLVMTVQYRSTRTQARLDLATAAANTELRQILGRDLELVLDLPAPAAQAPSWEAKVARVLGAHPEMLRIEQRDPAFELRAAVDSRLYTPTFSYVARSQMHVDTDIACASSRRRSGPAYSDAYFVPLGDGAASEVMDLCIVEREGETVAGYLVVSYSLPALLDQVGNSGAAEGNDLILLGSDGTRAAHGSLRAGAGVYRANRMVDLPGTALQLQLESPSLRPRLVPDAMGVFVVSLSLALIGVVAALMMDMRRRAGVESALADALSFRKAMEDSLVTGLRARDLQGRITYANPAFCAMVGFRADELIGSATPPYWPPEQRLAYQERRASRLASKGRDTFETVFMRKDGERFPSMVFEAPLIGVAGQHTGWVSAIVDLSAQRQVEEIARQQQERLQGTARLATAGEMASLLSHELTQPLSAIAAYATGTLNMLADDGDGPAWDAQLPRLIKEGLVQIADQAHRAGRTIKSVHNFVRRREGSRERTAVAEMMDAILPLIRLQARKNQAGIEIEIDDGTPHVLCDRAMVEQVLLNLARNGLQAMQSTATDVAPTLTLHVRAETHAWIRIGVRDRGSGIDDRTAAQLFKPFFTTRADGMGLGLSVCRTIVEQHGGTLAFANLRDPEGRICGAEFSFTLPAAHSSTPDDTDRYVQGETQGGTHDIASTRSLASDLELQRSTLHPDGLPRG